MSVELSVPGKPGKDNAAFVLVNSGNRLMRFLFDCGESVLNSFQNKDIGLIDAIFFSHFHLDHALGFDYFMRRNYSRATKPVHIFGPQNTAKYIYNRLNGYIWNLTEGMPGEWIIHELTENKHTEYKMFTAEGFAKLHFTKDEDLVSNYLDVFEGLSISYALLDHKIPSVGYSLKELPSNKIDVKKLTELNLPAGPWLEEIRNGTAEVVEIAGKTYKASKLKEKLLFEVEGMKFTYLTDFIFNDDNINKIKQIAGESDILVCESQYMNEDITHAKNNFHLTAKEAGTIAKQNNVKKLVVFHISERYGREEQKELLKQVKEVFAESSFPESWSV